MLCLIIVTISLIIRVTYMSILLKSVDNKTKSKFETFKQYQLSHDLIGYNLSLDAFVFLVEYVPMTVFLISLTISYRNQRLDYRKNNE